ncbi:MAG: DUF72 domain-containing protein [Chloroflexi bacterium]|nr:MAG: DUF72 domain-containing protein [Chloroflexota bacterium]
MDGSARIKVGCCGFRHARKHYFSRFRLVEVQQSFYKLPKVETGLRWRKEAPADFEFTVKAWQVITHPATSPTYRKAGIDITPGSEDRYGFFAPTEEVHRAWELTRRFAEALEAKVVVFQCPPSFRETRQNIDNLRRFFKSEARGFLRVWEPRGGWAEDTIKALCQELDLIHCVDPMVSESVHGRPAYFRLHGGTRYRHQYSEEELIRLRDKIGTDDAYVLFNNLNMYNDALTFDRLVKEGAGNGR